jgi:RNA polymerase sigma factor (sigma-70 family)
MPRCEAVRNDNNFEAMVAAHHADIYRYLVRVTGHAADADDLSQETFLRAYRAYRASAIEDPRAWLFTLATNLCRNHFRSLSRRGRAHDAVSTGAFEVDTNGPQAAAEGREASRAIEAAVSRLPFKQRVAFLQRKVHGLEYEAIGVSLGCSAESARAHVFQALKKIRRALEGDAPLRRSPS